VQVALIRSAATDFVMVFILSSFLVHLAVRRPAVARRLAGQSEFGLFWARSPALNQCVISGPKGQFILGKRKAEEPGGESRHTTGPRQI
jgi:hypothetical protein